MEVGWGGGGGQLLIPNWNASMDVDMISQAVSLFQFLRVCGQNEVKSTG